MPDRPKSSALRILVIRLSAMGDVIMTVPVISALRREYPNSEIVILTPAFLQPFFHQIEGVHFFAPDFSGRHKGFTGVLKLSIELGKFDIVADLHDVLRTKMLRRILKLKGARIAHIDKGREEKKALVSLENKKLVQLKTTIERYRDVFLKLGFDLPVILPPTPQQYPLSSETAALSGSRTKIWIGVAPFAQHEGKIYPLELMEQVIAQLTRIPDVRLFIFGGGANEQAYAEQIASTHPHVVSAIGKIKLAQEMELISNLDVMISMDSSAMHMASLVGVPVVSIWGATHPYAGFYGMGQNPQNAVQLDMPCRPCSIYGNKPCVKGKYPCMYDLEPALVVERVCQQLGIDVVPLSES